LKVALGAVEPRLQIRDALSDQAQMAQDLLLVETLPHDPEGRRRSDGICRRETWLGLGLGLVHGSFLSCRQGSGAHLGDTNVLRSD
jgi:hypothetical protein